MVEESPITFLPSLTSLTPKLFAEVFTNERMRIEMLRDCADPLAATSLALLNLARIVRHSLGLKSVKDSVRPGIAGGF